MNVWRMIFIGLGSFFSGAGLAAFIIIGRWTWLFRKIRQGTGK
nr:hypothetical protein [uncultured Cellulosilyticum sp.]